MMKNQNLKLNFQKLQHLKYLIRSNHVYTDYLKWNSCSINKRI